MYTHSTTWISTALNMCYSIFHFTSPCSNRSQSTGNDCGTGGNSKSLETVILSQKIRLCIKLWRAWFYVAPSRCRTLSGVTLSIEHLPLPPHSRYLITQQYDVHCEMARLEVIAMKTKHRVNKITGIGATIELKRLNKRLDVAFRRLDKR